jgi:hypothetical protein
MAYTINKTDGSPIATVADGQIDQASTDITLVGKNYSGFGEYLNENLVHILENFANESQPNNALTGQLWYDTSESRLKIYSGSEWNAIGTAVLAESRPLTVGVGDFWFNSLDKQLYFFDGVRDYLLGPDYSYSQGLSGLRIEQIEDNSRRFRVVAALYVNGILLGYNSASEFAIRNRPSGYNADPTDPNPIIKIGFNPANPSDFKFRGIANDADKLGTYVAAEYPRKSIANTFLDTISVSSLVGLQFGPGLQGKLEVETSGDVYITNISNNKKIAMKVSEGGIPFTVFDIKPAPALTEEPAECNIFPTTSNSLTTIGGDMTVNGNLTVLGNTVSIDVTNLRVENKNIELGFKSDSTVLTDVEADGGGIVLKGDSDHSLLWEAATGDWKSSENIDLTSPLASYKIGGTELLRDTGNSFELTSAVTSAPGLSSFGAQLSITADNITINNNRISNNVRTTPYSDGGSANPANIIIDPVGDIILDGITSPKIIGLQTTNEDNINQTTESSSLIDASELTEATSKNYVTNLVRTRNIPLTLDITGQDPLMDDPLTENQIATILESIAPSTEHDIGTEARISTFRYYLPDLLPITPELSVTFADGYVQTVAADEIPRRAFARPLVRRGFQIFQLQASGAPSGKTWIRTTIEEDDSPTTTYSGLFGSYV